MGEAAKSDVTAHDERTHYRCPMLGGPVPFSHCRTTATGEPCARILTCWQHVFDVETFLAAHYDLQKLLAAWSTPRKDKVLNLIDLIRRARGEGPDE